MNITKELASILLVESASFRDYAVEVMFSKTTNVRSAILSFIIENSKDKIKCIKHIREDYPWNAVTNSFPEWKFNTSYYSESKSTKLHLKDSKEFVEFWLNKLK